MEDVKGPRGGAGSFRAAPTTVLFAASCIVIAGTLVTARAGAGGFPCLFRLIFHIHCPGCGLWRSMQSAWRGEWILSVRYHPLGLVLLAACWVTVALQIGRWISHRPAPQIHNRRPWRAAGVVLFTLMIALWLFRLADDYWGSHLFLW